MEMNNLKILTVIGARPQFIKAAAISRALLGGFKNINEVSVHTGQHYDQNMSDIFFKDMEIPHPDYNLGIGGGSHGQNTGRMLEKLEQLMCSEKPDWVLVYGDTDSTLAGALAAAKLHIPIAHIEAGLRSFNKQMPEEINRVLTDHLADLLLAPTWTASENLQKEGIGSEKIHVVGDVMFDATLHYAKNARMPVWFSSLNLEDFVLCTIHREENTDNKRKLENILNALGSTTIPIVLPLHPRTRKQLSKFNIKLPSAVHVVEPVGYLEMAWLESNCRFIITDSGGVQKEAYFHNKFCITLRDETEWTELVDDGVNVLVGADERKIREAVDLASKNTTYLKNIKKKNHYGNGESAKSILNIISACGARQNLEHKNN